MELTIDPEAAEIIDRYMDERKPKSAGLERICIDKMHDMAEKVFKDMCSPRIRLKGQELKENDFDRKRDEYFQGGSWYRFTWQWERRGWGMLYFLHGKCERYFQDNSKKIILDFLHNTYGTIEIAVLKTDSFTKLAEEYLEWFEERRMRFMEQTDTDIQKWKEACAASKPQSHGGVANLLKVLTKTMEKQGADIQNIAKVQYAVCVQAGIYIPDEFIRDVAVLVDMKEIGENKEE